MHFGHFAYCCRAGFHERDFHVASVKVTLMMQRTKFVLAFLMHVLLVRRVFI